MPTELNNSKSDFVITLLYSINYNKFAEHKVTVTNTLLGPMGY